MCLDSALTLHDVALEDLMLEHGSEIRVRHANRWGQPPYFSAHHIEDPRLCAVIDAFVAREGHAIARYVASGGKDEP